MHRCRRSIRCAAKATQGHIVLVGDEPYLPYNRPPLSKKYLSGEMERERLLLRSAQFYEQAHVETRLGLRVTAIDRTDQRLRLSDGDELHYDKLMLCIGSRPRLLEVPGYDLPGIHYLRTIADVDAIRADLAAARKPRGRGRGIHRAGGCRVCASSRPRRHGSRNGGPPDEPRRGAGDLDVLPATART